ncbi:hypothetical protein Q8F55_003808 [Vanrija albida]|uniref:Uncharacterized protein n=1 Tax=Vanrija albida TaxID=181172 RepID=A0ABR3Q507_9TREE
MSANRTDPTSRQHGAQPAHNAKHAPAPAPAEAIPPGFAAERNRTRRFSEHSDSSEPGCLEQGGATTRGADRANKSLSHDFDTLMSDLGWHIDRAGQSVSDTWSSAVDDTHAALPDLRAHWDALCAKVGSQFESLGAARGSNEAVEAVREQTGTAVPVAGGHAARSHSPPNSEARAEASAQRTTGSRRLV